jgi:hypothetical protein
VCDWEKGKCLMVKNSKSLMMNWQNSKKSLFFRYIEVWMLLGIKYTDLQLFFTACVHLPPALEELFEKFRNIFEKASFVFPIDSDPKVMLEYTAMYFKAKAMLGEIFLIISDETFLYSIKYVFAD